jgi:hypothetical protein
VQVPNGCSRICNAFAVTFSAALLVAPDEAQSLAFDQKRGFFLRLAICFGSALVPFLIEPRLRLLLTARQHRFKQRPPEDF